MDKEYNELREEWDNGFIRIMASRNLGQVCYNCGSDKAVELHHVVPLKLGGTNNISNIVVLCHKCHMAAHHGRHIRDYCNKKISGRPKTASDEVIAKALDDYFACKIGAKEFMKRVGAKVKRPHITDKKYYRDYLKQRKVKSLENYIDWIAFCKREIKTGDLIGVIHYENGEEVSIYAK